jgi:hypothetical protein
MNTVENTQEAKTQDSSWEKSSISNLVRWKSSKIPREYELLQGAVEECLA